MEYTEREIRKTAQNLAHALSIIEGQKCSVHGFEFLQDSTVLAEFHISVGGVDYDGGSYEVMENGEIRNIAIRNSPSYATVGDGADAIVKRIVGEDLMGEESPLRNPLRENEAPFAKLFMGAEYSMLGGIREEFKDAETFEARYNQNGTIAYNEKEWVGDLGNERGAVFLGSDGKDKYFYIHKRIVKVVKGLKNETLVQPVIDFNDYRGEELIHITDERRKLAKIFDDVMKNYDRHTEYRRAETFDVEFNEWADQEMLTHGQDISFRDWAKDEGKKHGNVPITDWAEHEEESHDERYGAESKKTKYGMIAAGVITAFALLPEIKKRF